jgi:hypothetical protein
MAVPSHHESNEAMEMLPVPNLPPIGARPSLGAGQFMQLMETTK